MALARWHGLQAECTSQMAMANFRSEFYRLHVRDAEADLPGASGKLEGASAPSFAVPLKRGHLILTTKRFFDARIFDSNRMLR